MNRPRLKKRINRLSNKLGSEGFSDQRNEKIATRIQRLQGRQATRGRNVTGPGADQLAQYLPGSGFETGGELKVDPIVDPVDPNASAAPSGDPVDPISRPSQPTFRDTRQFLPRDLESTPGYKFLMDSGQRQLNQRFAANGLQGSGREARAAHELGESVAATIYDRELQTAAGDADRYDRYAIEEARRLERAGDSQFDRQMRLLDLMLGQNPLQYAYQGTQDLAGIMGDRGKYATQFAAGNYARPTIGIGGGGARTPLPTFIPPFASGPDFSGVDAAAAQGGYADAQNNGNIINQIFGAIGGLF